MADIVDGAAIQAAVLRVAGRLESMADELNRLDAAMGDGDLGITAAKGGHAWREYVAANPLTADVEAQDLGKYLAGLGSAYNRATVSSTMGALIATALMRAGKEARGQSTLDGALLARMWAAADAGVQERGGAQPGEKTLVDALHPATVAFAEAIGRGETLASAASALLAAARAGRDAAIPLRGKIGRAGWIGERTENRPDPGTVLFVGVLEAALGVEPGQ